MQKVERLSHFQGRQKARMARNQREFTFGENVHFSTAFPQFSIAGTKTDNIHYRLVVILFVAEFQPRPAGFNRRAHGDRGAVRRD